jgi:predicted dehydrogenase
MMGLGALNGYLKDSGYQITSVCDPERDSNKYPGRPGGAPGGREEGRRRVEKAYAENTGKGTYKGCNAYADFRELLEKEKGLDAVFNFTPDHLHAPINIAAMKKKVNVATHKPISNFLNEVRASIDYANKSGVPTHCYFFQDPPKTYTMMQLMKQGIIGKVTELHRWTNRPTWPKLPCLSHNQFLKDLTGSYGSDPVRIAHTLLNILILSTGAGLNSVEVSFVIWHFTVSGETGGY